MSEHQNVTTPKSPLDAAQKIVAELQGMAPEDQLLALKFAMETLRLTSQITAPTPQHTAPQSTPISTSIAVPPNAAGHATDIRQFTEMKAPKSDQQFAAVVAYFYQFEAPPMQRKESIDVETMKTAARLVGRGHPPQWRFTLQNAKNAGYLDSAGNGSYKLSSVGENLVAITLPDGAASPAKGRSKRSLKRVTKSAKPSKKS